MPQSKSVLERRKKHQISDFGKSLTVQSEKMKCCVNNIVAKYNLGHEVTHLRNSDGFYTDVSETADFQTAMNIVASADQLFETLPSKLQAEFNHDTAEFLTFINDEKNLPAMEEMGLSEPLQLPSEPENPAPAIPDEPLLGETEGNTA